MEHPIYFSFFLFVLEFQYEFNIKIGSFIVIQTFSDDFNDLEKVKFFGKLIHNSGGIRSSVRQVIFD